MVLNSVGSANLPGKCGKRKFCVSAVYSTGRCCTDGRFDAIDPLGSHFVCHICSKTFSTNRKLWRHNLQHKEKRYSCGTCGKRYAMASLVRSHIQMSHQKIRKFACPLCDFKATQKIGLQSHLIRHSKDYPFKCDLCEKGFVSRSDLVLHTSVEHEGVRYSCEYCPKVYKTQASLLLHIKRHDPNFVATVSCPQCLKSMDKHSLKRHIKSYHEDKQKCVCDVCGKEVVSLAQLTIHKKIHTGEKKHVCDVCGKAFIKKTGLTTHLRVHTKEKPYKCKVCDKAFTQKGTLNIHMRYHTGERPYKCDCCSKQFISNTALNTHRCLGK